jgi:hypothetical protein
MDVSGKELLGPYRRFHTLGSLGLSSWSEVDARHLRLILDSCRSYFRGNPYDTWFRRLDCVVRGAGASYYDGSPGACHLDLIPYATTRKWTELTRQQRASLLAIASDTLGLLLRDSPVRILILNGSSVVEQFEDITGVSLEKRVMHAWSLRRQSKPDVPGFAYTGVVDTVAGIGLGHEVLILGFNHNLQSSFGISTELIHDIRSWVARTSSEAEP